MLQVMKMNSVGRAGNVPSEVIIVFAFVYLN